MEGSIDHDKTHVGLLFVAKDGLDHLRIVRRMFISGGGSPRSSYRILGFCMDLAAVRSALLLCLKDKRQEAHWQRGFWIGLLWWMLFVWSWSVAGNNAFTLWTFPVTAWTDLDGLMFVR